MMQYKLKFYYDGMILSSILISMIIFLLLVRPRFIFLFLLTIPLVQLYYSIDERAEIKC